MVIKLRKHQYFNLYTLQDFLCSKVRFIHTSIATGLHSCPEKKLRVRLAYILFTISNSVRQGGISCPKLSFVYMDDLSKLLINSGIGCFIDNVCFNHVFYAEDLCLMAPCTIALQELLNICHSYSISVDVNFNQFKLFFVDFTPKHLCCHYRKLVLTLLIFYTQI